MKAGVVSGPSVPKKNRPVSFVPIISLPTFLTSYWKRCHLLTRTFSNIVSYKIQFCDCILDCDLEQYLGSNLDQYLGHVLENNLWMCPTQWLRSYPRYSGNFDHVLNSETNGHTTLGCVFSTCQVLGYHVWYLLINIHKALMVRSHCPTPTQTPRPTNCNSTQWHRCVSAVWTPPHNTL